MRQKLKSINNTSAGHDSSTYSGYDSVNEKEVLRMLDEDDTSDNFHKNKDKLLGMVYQLTK